MGEWDQEGEEYEHRLRVALERRYRQRLSAAPDCRDPEHPGCQHCIDDEDIEGEEQEPN